MTCVICCEESVEHADDGTDTDGGTDITVESVGMVL